ncbi:GntR family transcriptional regulator [Streptomyces sp. NPDC016562]|uniref:GntR family transcriptional regulator n=1 Tax=Streptomyces sp. NPDC016562 TaxID=3364966 RepID=UPI0036FF992E
MGENHPVTSTNLKITLDTAAGSAAPYEQLRAQIADRARSGRLPAGYKLPTVRGLAQELGLAANTVAKAYRALEADGVIETRGRNGTFVAAAGDSASREAASAAQAYAERVHRLGLTQAEATAAAGDAVRARYAQ